MEKIKEKLSCIYSQEMTEEIFKKYEETIKKDLHIIQSQTDLEYELTVDLYINNNFDSVKSICVFFDIPYENKKKEKELTDIQKKLLELRLISDNKDNYYETNISS